MAFLCVCTFTGVNGYKHPFFDWMGFVFCVPFLSFFFLAVWTIFEYVEAVSYIFTNLSNYDGILSLINT